MQPLIILKYIAYASLRFAGRYLGVGVPVGLAEVIWTKWNKERNDAQRRAKLQAVAQMAALNFQQQVEAVVEQVADKRPQEVRRRLLECLEQVADLASQAVHRQEDQIGQSVPPGFPLGWATDQIPFYVSFQPVIVTSEREPENFTAVAQRSQVNFRFQKARKAGRQSVFAEPEVLVTKRPKTYKRKLLVIKLAFI